MFGRLLNALSGGDDLERIASKEDRSSLDAYLKTRRVLVPCRPRRFLDASGLTEEQLLGLIRQESEEAARSPFEPWVLEIDGSKRLPVFSNQKRLEVFSRRISEHLGKVFALGSAEVLLDEVTSAVEIDFIALNLFGEKSWEIAVRERNG